jgi:hypothetical protein
MAKRHATWPTGLLLDPEDAGKLQGYSVGVSAQGYARIQRRENGKNVVWYVHRLVAGQPPSGMSVDHINGDRLDNRRSNLRFATGSLQALNRHRSQARSGQRCVTRRVLPSGAVRFQVAVMHHGRSAFRGSFSSMEQAVVARDAALSTLTKLELGL